MPLDRTKRNQIEGTIQELESMGWQVVDERARTCDEVSTAAGEIVGFGIELDVSLMMDEKTLQEADDV